MDAFGADDLQAAQPSASGPPNKKNYVSQSAVALRCRVMPPVCIKNPYLNETNEMDLDIFGSRRSKSTGTVHAFISFPFVKKKKKKEARTCTVQKLGFV